MGSSSTFALRRAYRSSGASSLDLALLGRRAVDRARVLAVDGDVRVAREKRAEEVQLLGEVLRRDRLYLGPGRRRRQGRGPGVVVRDGRRQGRGLAEEGGPGVVVRDGRRRLHVRRERVDGGERWMWLQVPEHGRCATAANTRAGTWPAAATVLVRTAGGAVATTLQARCRQVESWRRWRFAGNNDGKLRSRRRDLLDFYLPGQRSRLGF